MVLQDWMNTLDGAYGKKARERLHDLAEIDIGHPCCIARPI